MSRLFQLLFLVFFCVSCAEKLNLINPTEFNEKIAGQTDIKSAEELIKIYYNYPTTGRPPKLDIKSRNLGKDLVEVTLIHYKQEDYSQEAIKNVMVATLKGDSRMVHKIKTNLSCYKGRGHTNWGIERCK